MKRWRGFAIAALVVALVIAVQSFGPRLSSLGSSALSFDPIAGLNGYRKLTGERSTTQAGNVFVGIGEEPRTTPVVGDVYAALHGPRNVDGRVPVAYFFDQQCAICRTLSPRLAETEGIALTYHPLSGLGVASQVAARAFVAADMQGQLPAFHARMNRAAFLPDEDYVRTVAQSIGLDADQLLADMNSAPVEARLDRDAALAARFGMYGTPALVVGCTLVIGDIDNKRLNALVADETALDPARC